MSKYLPSRLIQSEERGRRVNKQTLSDGALLGFSRRVPINTQSSKIPFMSPVQEIGKAIQALPESDVRTLTQWLDDYAESKWDKRIEADVAQDNLTSLAEVARAARVTGMRRRFP